MKRALSLLLCLACCGCQPTPGEHTFSGATMGTTWTGKLICTASEAAKAAPLIQSRLDELEAIFSTWREDSAITRFNVSTSTEWQPVPAELAQVVARAQHFSELTNGAFDITIAPLLAAWGFGAHRQQERRPPAEDLLVRLKETIGWQKLEVKTQPPQLRKTQPGLRIDVSSLVEGWALDELAARLHEAGLQDFLLEIGGEMIASGVKSDGSKWTVGIQQPGHDRQSLATATPLLNQAISTAGVYQQYWEFEGQRYAHVLDARVGKPVSHSLQSVSVKAPRALEADGWATVLLILGPEEGRALAEKHGVSAVFLELGSQSLMPGK